MKFKLLALLSPLFLVLLFTGCSGDADAFAEALLAQESDVAGISVATDRPLMSVGETQTLTASAQSASGADDFVWDNVTWGVSDTQLATISDLGVLSAKSSGTVELTAEYAGYIGSASVEIDNASLRSISISPSGNVDVCRSIVLTATGNYGEGDERDISNLVNWSTTAVAGITVGDLTSNKGVMSTTDAAGYRVSASYAGTTGDATINALDNNLGSISITPLDSTVNTAAAQQYVAQASYTTATLTPPATPDSSSAAVVDSLVETITTHANWSVANTSTATIDSSGLLTAKQSGQTTVTAECGGKSGTTSITTNEVATVTRIEIRVDGNTKTVASVTQSEAADIEITLYAEYSDGRTAANVTDDATWSISLNEDVATVSNSGTSKGELTVLTAGTVTLLAEFSNLETLLQLTIE